MGAWIPLQSHMIKDVIIGDDPQNISQSRHAKKSLSTLGCGIAYGRTLVNYHAIVISLKSGPGRLKNERGQIVIWSGRCQALTGNSGGIS